MKTLRRTAVLSVLVTASFACLSASADVFNMGGVRNPTTGQWTGLASLEFVTVGDLGNAADPLVQMGITSGSGAVGYTYKMGKYDVTAAQYCQFLNAVAAVSDPYGLYAWNMAPEQSGLGGFGIVRNGKPGNYVYSVAGNPNFPMICVTWGSAARFCNWLSNGQGGAGTTETGSYTLNGATSTAALLAVTRNPGAKYAIPTEDEWYKAAYYKGGGKNTGYWLYPTRSNSLPSNVLSSAGTNNANIYLDGFTDPTNYLTAVGAFASSPGPYGTFDMGGDVFQWNEAVVSDSYIIGTYRQVRGAAYYSYVKSEASTYCWGDPASAGTDSGLRIVQVPEPTTLTILALGSLLAACRRRESSTGRSFRKGS